MIQSRLVSRHWLGFQVLCYEGWMRCLQLLASLSVLNTSVRSPVAVPPPCEPRRVQSVIPPNIQSCERETYRYSNMTCTATNKQPDARTMNLTPATTNNQTTGFSPVQSASYDAQRNADSQDTEETVERSKERKNSTHHANYPPSVPTCTPCPPCRSRTRSSWRSSSSGR
jgi:hypothetical protein